MSANIRSEEQFFRQVVDELSNGVFVADHTGRIVYANERAGTLLGVDHERLPEAFVEEVFTNGDVDCSLDNLRNRVSADDRSSVTLDWLDRPLSLSLAEITVDERQWVVLSIRDASDGSRAAQDDVFFEKAFEAANDAMLVFDPAADEILDCNPRACELLGYARDELLSLGPSDIHPHEIDQFQSFVDTVLEDGQGWTDELSCYTCNREAVPTEVSASRVTVADRPCLLVSMRDISSRRQYQRRLEALNETTRELLAAESIPAIGRITLDIVETILDCRLSAVWTVDEEANQLTPVETTDAVADLVEAGETDASRLVIEADTVEMRAFRDGEPRFISEYSEVDDPAHPDLPLRNRFLLPLGEHGLLAVGSTDTEQITPSVRNLLRILAGNAETVLDRIASEQKLRHRSAAIEAANDGIAMMDEDGEFVFVNAAYAAIFGYDQREELLETTWRDLLDEDSVEKMVEEVITTVESEWAWRGELTGVRRDGSAVPLGVAVTRLEDGGFVNVCSDISDRKAQERRLKALNNLNQTLMQADDWSEISQAGIEAVCDCLPCDIVAVQRYDPETNALELDTMTEQAASLLESRPAYDLESTYAGTAYRRGEPVVKDLSSDETTVEYLEYSSLHVPLQEYGTLSILTDEAAGFDEEIVEFVRLLGMGIGIAYERVEREQALRENRDDLTRLNRINAVVREIIQSLVEAATRTEIENVICEQLTDSELYEYAWIGEVDIENERIVPRTGAGIETDLLDAMAGITLFEAGTESVLNAVQSGEIETVRQYHISDEDAELDPATIVDEPDSVEAVAAIPLSYGSRVYGVLIVNTTHPEQFDEGTREEFKLLGETAGFAINAVRNRQLLLSNRMTQLKFDVWDSNSLVAAVSGELDCKCRLEIAEPTDGGGVRCFLRARGIDVDDPVQTVQSVAGVEHAEVVDESNGECMFEIVRSEPLAQELARTGASVRKAVGADGQAEIVLEAPQSADIREIVDKYQSLYPDSELVAKRERERSGQSAEAFWETFQAELTERQLSVLESAYEAGYFDWPRERTAEEVADEIGIASPTLHQHLRTAQRKLLTTLLDET